MYSRLVLLQIACVAATCLAPTWAQQSAYVNIGYLNVTFPGFSNPYEHPGWTDPTERYSLMVSTFDYAPDAKDTSNMFLYVGKSLGDLESVQPTVLSDVFTWPREPSQTPLNAFGFETVTQPDGFIPPDKQNGTVSVIDISDLGNTMTYDLIRDPFNPSPFEWFYQGVSWLDMDLDGDLDALTCRTRTFGFPSQESSQMLWLEHPSGDPFSGPWTQHVIHQDICGTFQYGITLNVTGEEPLFAIFTIGYFTNLFAVHWTTDPNGSWADPSNVQTRIIDTGRKFFYMTIADINKDGRQEIVMTWNSYTNGSLVAYEIPDDFRTGEYNFHFLSTGFVPRGDENTAGVPGTSEVYYPDTDESGKPWILLSGEDDGRCYYLTPQSEDETDWGYDLITVLDTGALNIVGEPSVMDANGDGRKELYIPVYYEQAVYVMDLIP